MLQQFYIVKNTHVVSGYSIIEADETKVVIIIIKNLTKNSRLCISMPTWLTSRLLRGRSLNPGPVSATGLLRGRAQLHFCLIYL